MAGHSLQAVQKPFWPFQLRKDMGEGERRASEHAGPTDLAGAVSALNRPKAHALRGGCDVDEVLPAANYPHSHRREYRVHLPPDYDPAVPAPMIMVLHGCHQTHLDIQQISQFDAIADREGAIVVYPWVTGYRGLRTVNCWGWWMRSHRTRGQGEVEDLARMAREVANKHAVDPARRFICGLSSGACMSVVSLVAASETWTAGASIAGVPYGEDARAVRISRFLAPRFRSRLQLRLKLQRVHGYRSPPPLLIVQSTGDAVVTTANSRHLRDQWADASSIASRSDCQSCGISHQLNWQLQGHHNAAGKLQILCFTIEKLIHGWFGGAEGRYSVPDAPNLSELIWWFFQQQSNRTEADDAETDASALA